MSFEQKQSPFWWTRNPQTVVYFLRELTGVFIALYVMIFLTLAMTDATLNFSRGIFFKTISWIGLIAAVIHTLTWFWVTVKITPVLLPKWMQLFLFLLLVVAWLIGSYFLLIFLYV
ncbi:MAG: hypothetical protein AAB588_05300 [Patescibacteria group bacterium]